MSRYRLRIAGALAGLAAITASLLPSMAFAEVNPDQVPASLNAAIKAEIESKGHKYAGLCRVVNEGNPVPGEYCAFVLSIEHDIAEVTYGRVLSDELTRVNFHNQNGTWVKEGTTPTTPTQPTTPTTPSNPSTPKPPATGDGLSEDSGSDSTAVLFGAAAVAVAGLGVTGVAIARKR
jgi:hypothetical protein